MKGPRVEIRWKWLKGRIDTRPRERERERDAPRDRPKVGHCETLKLQGHSKLADDDSKRRRRRGSQSRLLRRLDVRWEKPRCRRRNETSRKFAVCDFCTLYGKDTT